MKDFSFLSKGKTEKNAAPSTNRISLLDLKKSAETMAKPHVASYDFTSAKKFSAEQLRFLTKIYSNYADYLQTALTYPLQLKVYIKQEKLENLTHQEYVTQLSDITTTLIVKLSETERGVIAFDPNISFILIDRLMGGKGELSEEFDLRALTELEINILSAIFQKMVDSMVESWRNIAHLKISLEAVDSNPLIYNVSPNEVLTVCRLQLRIGNYEGSYHLCLPYNFVKGIIPKTSFTELLSKTGPHQPATGAVPQVSREAIAPLIGKKVEAAKVDLVVVLGKAEVLFQDLADISPGDVLLLDTKVEEGLKAKIGDTVKFIGTPATTKNNRYGIKIKKVVKEGDEEYEDR